MSTVSSTASSADVTYATQLAQTSALTRTLGSLNNAMQAGDLISAGSILTAFMKANPQDALSSSASSSSSDPINQDFQTLENAISNNQADAAQSAWTKVKSDLTKDGVTNLGNGASSTAQLVAQAKASISQQILSDAFGTSSSGGLSVASLIGGGSDASSDTGLSSSLIGSWLTYQAGGSTTPQSTAAGTVLNTTA